MPVLDKIPRLPEEEKSIDVLFYGSVNPRRLKIFTDLTQIGMKVDFNWYNLWSEKLMEKISRAKIVLNIHFYDNPILEASRLSYLIGNGAFVISERSTDPILDKEFEKYLVFTDYDHIVESCLKYLIKKDERYDIANKGYESFILRKYSDVIPTSELKKYNVGESNEVTDAAPGSTNAPLPGYSDIKFYYKEAEMETTEDGSEVLKLPNISLSNLPNVSIVTLTYNRSEMIDIAVRNFQRFIYPEDKMEWVIVDDSNERHQAINKKKVARDPRVKYIPLEKRISISEKRNLAVNESKYDIIVHMDDDDYYPPESVLARVKLLLKYAKNGVGCVGCKQIGVYNLTDNYSYLLNCKFPSEASLAYTKEFWNENHFPSKDVPEGEGIPFVYKRTDQVVIMPYMFNLIAITHHKNITGKLRTLNLDQEEKYTNFFNLWDFNTQLFFLDVLGNIKKEQKLIESKSKNL